jgi:hypothetical protein
VNDRLIRCMRLARYEHTRHPLCAPLSASPPCTVYTPCSHLAWERRTSLRATRLLSGSLAPWTVVPPATSHSCAPPLLRAGAVTDHHSNGAYVHRVLGGRADEWSSSQTGSVRSFRRSAGGSPRWSFGIASTASFLKFALHSSAIMVTAPPRYAAPDESKPD